MTWTNFFKRQPVAQVGAAVDVPEERNIINEDICAKCDNCTILKKSDGYSWDAQATCSAGWPKRKVFMNVISDCVGFKDMK